LKDKKSARKPPAYPTEKQKEKTDKGEKKDKSKDKH